MNNTKPHLPVALITLFKSLIQNFWFYGYIYLYRLPHVFTNITCKSIIDTTSKLRLLPYLSYFRPVVT